MCMWGEWWLRVGSEVQSLSLHSTGMGQAEFTRLLTPCKKLRVLNLNGSRSLFHEGQCVCVWQPHVAFVSSALHFLLSLDQILKVSFYWTLTC